MTHHDDQRPTIGKWRAALATGVASAALFAYSGRPVRAQGVEPPTCVISPTDGSVVNCTGDQSGGIELDDGTGPFRTLNVFALTTDITPGPTLDGIRFTSTGSVAVNSDTSPFAIFVTGANKYGIYAQSTAGGAVTITSTGDITSTDGSTIGATTNGSGSVSVSSFGNLNAGHYGINAHAVSGDVIVITGGSITSTDAGIFAASDAGGDVTVISAGTISTTGDGADGVIAATSGPNTSGNVAITSTGDIITQGAGASGIQAGIQNGLATIMSSGDIATSGNNAHGIAAGTVYGDVVVNSSGNIATSGAFSAGINVGTIGDDGTTEGSITIRSYGDIATSGASAIGINASTVYGPIDITSFGDVAVSGAASIGINAQTRGDVTITTFGDVAAGSNSSVGILALSQSSNVLITTFGTVATAGNTAPGIHASAGATATVRAVGPIVTSGNNSPGIAASGDTGTAVVSTGNIRTFGVDSPGITAYGAGDVTIISTGDIATSGNIIPVGPSFYPVGAINGLSEFGDVTITSTGRITTAGDKAVGIAAFAGGNAYIRNSADVTTTGQAADGISAASMTGSVEIVNTGDISATGTGSAGIYAGGWAGNMVVNFGTIEGCPCAGVVLFSAGNNELTNFGSIISDLTGNAIESAGLENRIDNYGVITGNVLFITLGPGTSQFNNHAGALFNSGDFVMAGLVTNDGTIAPGGRGAVLDTILGDNFVQNAGGVFAVDVDGVAGTADAITVVAGTADLAGNVVVSMLQVPVDPIESFVILSADGGVTNNGLSLTASPALHATLTYPNATDVVLGIAVDFGVDGIGLNPNQKAIGENLDKIFRAGVGGVGPVLLGLLNVDSIDEFKNALNQLSPELYSDAQIAALYSSLAFSNSLLSCKVNGTDTASIIREGQCLWAGASARFMNASTTSDQIGFDETAGLFTAGAQVALDDVWRLGVAGGYQSSTMQTATGAQSEGSLAQVGVSLKYNPGPLLLAGALTGGGASYDTTRPMAFGGFTGVAEGNQDLGIFSAAFRAAYVLGSPGLYFKPILDASLTHLELGGFTEGGGNGAALSIDGGGHTVFSLAPTLEAGTEWWLGNGTLVRPLIRAGAVWYDGADFALTASFAGAPLGVSPFTINTNIDEVMGLVGAGLEVINGDDAVLRLSYDGQLGADTQIHSVGIKGSSKF